MRSFHISETSLLSMLLGVVFLSSCKEYNHSEEVECEKIVFSSLEQRPLSELQADTTYLLLRSSNPDCPVGSVSKMIKSNGRYYFLDGRYRNAVAYDSLGRSIDRIGAVGKGHLEYLRCHDIAIDNQGYVYLSDGTGDKYIKYDPDFHAIEEHPANLEGTEFIFTEDHTMLVGISPWYEGEEGGKSVALLDSQLNITNTYGDIGTYDMDVILGGTGFTGSDQYISYVSKYEIRDDVMLFSPKDGRPVKRLIFDFGDKSVPKEYKSNLESNMPQIEKCTRLQDVFSVTDKHIVGRIAIDGKTRPFIIDAKARIVYLGDDVDSREECIAYVDDSFVSLAPIIHEQYPDSVNRHIGSGQTVLVFTNYVND